MAKFQLIDRTEPGNTEEEFTWHTFYDCGDGEPIEFAVRSWDRTTQQLVDTRLSDKQYVENLDIQWKKMPRGTGKRKLELKAILMADHLIAHANNVVTTDGRLLTRQDEPNIYDKAFIFHRDDVALWLIEKGKEGAAKIVEEDAKN